MTEPESIIKARELRSEIEKSLDKMGVLIPAALELALNEEIKNNKIKIKNHD